MPLLGKILLFFNLLAAGGLIYTAAQDWAKRQSITATALQYYLALSGLPLDAADGTDPDDVPFPVPTSGGSVNETVRESLVKAYFKGAEGGGQYGAAGTDKPVTTQLKEVKRVQEKADALIRAASETDRLELLCGKFQNTQFTAGILVRLAESFEERELIRRLALTNDPRAVTANAEEAEKILKKKFDAVLAKPDSKLAAEFADKLKAAAEKLRATAEPRQAAETKLVRAQTDKDDAAITAAQADVKTTQDAMDAAWKEFADVLAGDHTPAAPRDEADRRRRVAHLLVLLDRSADWQTRTAKVVGLKAYQNAIGDQTTRLQEMTRSVQRQIESDQASFVDLYEQLKILASDRASLAAEQAGISKSLADRAVRDNEAVNVRSAELAQRQKLFANVKSDVAAKLAAQAEVEKQLFEVQKQVGDTLQKNFDLEKQLDRAETTATGTKRKF